jgi:hypothetical protein
VGIEEKPLKNQIFGAAGGLTAMAAHCGRTAKIQL